MKRFIFISLLALAGIAVQAQTRINPNQIRWPLITGAGTPTAMGVSCTSIEYGMPYQNTAVTPNTRYHCAADGWEIESSAGYTGVTSDGSEGIIVTGNVYTPELIIGNQSGGPVLYNDGVTGNLIIDSRSIAAGTSVGSGSCLIPDGAGYTAWDFDNSGNGCVGEAFYAKSLNIGPNDGTSHLFASGDLADWTNSGAALNDVATCTAVTSGTCTAWGPAAGSGTAATLLAPSGDTTGATDCAAIQTACTSGAFIQLEVGTYYCGYSNATATISNSCNVQGASTQGTKIQNEGSTNYVFTVSEDNAPTGGTTLPFPAGPQFSNFQIVQDTGVTPTAGGGFLLGTGGSGYLTGSSLSDLLIQGTWYGITTQMGYWNNWITRVRMVNPVSGYGLYYNTQSTGGDLFATDDAVTNGSIYFNQADTSNFSGLKINTGNIVFGANSISNLRFTGLSVEQSTNCAFDFSLGNLNTLGLIQISNSEDEVNSTPRNHFCNQAAVGGLAVNQLCAGNTPGNLPGCVNLTPISYQMWDVFKGSSGAALTSHTANTGQTWTALSDTRIYCTASSADLKLTGATPSSLANTNGTQSTTECAESSLTPSSANYSVCATSSDAAGTGAEIDLNGRYASGKAYDAQWYKGYNAISLAYISSGTSTTIGTPQSFSWPSGSTHTFCLVMNGTTISATIDGNITTATGTDSNISAAGNVAIRLSGTSVPTLRQVTVQ
jgi:hypothetical protein